MAPIPKQGGPHSVHLAQLCCTQPVLHGARLQLHALGLHAKSTNCFQHQGTLSVWCGMLYSCSNICRHHDFSTTVC